MPEAHSQEAAKRISRAATRWIIERTVGLYSRMPSGEPVMHGSGVLLQIADAAFVLSAAHVLHTDPEAKLLVAPMENGSRMLGLGPQITVTRDQEQLDVGFSRLPEVVARELRKHKQFLRLNELEVANEPSNGLYSVIGYPQQMNTPDYVSKAVDVVPFCWGTQLYPGTVDQFEPGVSIALKLTEQMVTRFPDGGTERMPELKAISGCGIWRLYGIGDRIDRLDTWDSSWIRLSGIEHRVSKPKWIKGTMDGYIKGTLIRHIINIIAQACPDLRTSIQLTFPA